MPYSTARPSSEALYTSSQVTESNEHHIKQARKQASMGGIFAPSESINYNFVAGVYGFFSALCLLLLALHFHSPAVEGFFVTLLPFLPCFVWSLVVRAKWLAQQQKTAADTTTADTETKKDK